MNPTSVSLPYTMYNGIIYHDTEQDYNSNRILYEAPYANFDSSGTFRMMLRKWHSTHDDPDGKPVALNSHVYFYNTTNGGTTNFGYIGTSQIQMLKMYAIAEVDNLTISGISYWRIRLKQYPTWGSDYINISGYTNIESLSVGNHVRAAVFNYYGAEFFPYHPPTLSSTNHENSALFDMYHGFRGETRDGATRTSAEYRRAVVGNIGVPSNSRIPSETDYALQINGIIRDLHDPNRAWPERSALSSGL